MIAQQKSAVAMEMDEGIRGIIFDIKRYAIHDGPGIRTTVFLKGCPLRCAWCHNPEGRSSEIETMLSRTCDKSDHPSQEREIVGRKAAVSDVLEEVKKDVLFYEQSGGGVTFSGGEPMMQPAFLHALLAACKKEEIHTAVDTSGYAPECVVTAIAGLVDLFLFDLKIIHPTRHAEFTGVPNQRILENLRFLDSIKKATVIRFPVVPELTDTETNVGDVADFVASLQTMRRVALLPFHAMADGKYKRLRMPSALADITSPTPLRLDEITRRFEDKGIAVSVGG